MTNENPDATPWFAIGPLPSGGYAYEQGDEPDAEWLTWTLLDPIGTLVAGATIEALVGHSGGLPPIAKDNRRT